MEIEIQLTDQPIAEKILPPTQPGAVGAWLEFRGVVRGEENGQTIRALEYEAYPEMAGREIRRLLQGNFRAPSLPRGEGDSSRRRHSCRGNGHLRRRCVAASRRGHRVARRIHGPAQAGRADLETAGIAISIL